ncbi:MAG TPA: SDR family NAD(P)-dependent oxidoreductase [Desulfobacteraceae bacterium]|nr:SDR family NAD(P)-dependent oxidoreductase [Desulfobacteraceae bacterium]
MRATGGSGELLCFDVTDKNASEQAVKKIVKEKGRIDILLNNAGVRDDNGLLYLQVMDNKLAACGINDYRMAASQLAQTTLRSCIGEIDLDKTFGERETINSQVVDSIDQAARINEAEGHAQEILAVARETAEGLELIAGQLENDGGQAAASTVVMAAMSTTPFLRSMPERLRNPSRDMNPKDWPAPRSPAVTLMYQPDRSWSYIGRYSVSWEWMSAVHPGQS